MKTFIRLATGVIFLLTTTTLRAQEVFTGPLPGWADIKTRFGAKGNGKDDDTKSLQQALDAFSQAPVNYNMGKGGYTVLYLPAGTYCISSTLVLRGKTGVSIIGEDPATTIIKWTGHDADTMLWANGSAYFKIGRLTWDADNHKDIRAIGLHWKNRWTDNRSQSSAPVNIEISDNIFTGHCQFGICGGTVAGEGATGAMDSEISIRRCVFNGCTESGIFITGYNALDYWVWDCRFLDCKDGIRNNFGNYHVFRSYFKGSKLADVHNTNGYYTSVRGCYSEKPYIFSHDEGFSSNPFKRIFQSNIVESPSNVPIGYYHLGKISLVDNRLDAARQPAVKTFVHTGSWAKGNYEVLSVSNVYGDKTPITITSNPNKIFAVGDNYGAAAVKPDAASFLARQEKTPSRVKRTIITVPAEAGAPKIQELINAAIKMKGQTPVLYFPFGKYLLEKPLVIPAGADLQICGDGYLYASVLVPAAGFPKGKALLQVDGPTAVVIRDIQLGDFAGNMRGIDAIQFTHADQPNAKVFIDQLYTNSHNSIRAEGLDYLHIQETNSFYAYGSSITGGPLVQQGKGSAVLYSFGGQFAGATVDNNARLVAKDCWWEGPERIALNLGGKGYITIDGGMLAPTAADSNATVVINRFSGRIALLNMYLQGGIKVEPSNPNLDLLLWNIHFYHTLNPLKFNSPGATFKGAFAGLTTQCFVTGDKKCENINTVEDVLKGGVNLQQYWPFMLADDRDAMPLKYTAGTAGVSNIFISRISVGDCSTAIRFTR